MDAGERIKKVAVLGAGLMGHGIAEVCAMAGYEVTMRDIKQEFIDRGMSMIKESLVKLEQKGRIKSADEVLSRIKTTLDLEEAVKDADLVIEAVPEVVDIKKQVWEEVDRFAKKDAIFASNTSTMKITMLGGFTSRPDKFAGLHFFNPPVLMKLVEVIRGEKTDEETMQILVEFVKSIGKVPVRVEKDVPGFIVNRVQAPAGVLLMCIIEKGIATPEEVDATVRRLGLPMGPFELMDYTGVDIFYNAMKYYAKTISPDYEPPEFLEKMVRENKLGRKTGMGWYDWSAGRPKIDSSKATDRINPMDFTFVEINEAVRLVEMGVATPQDIDTAVKLGLNRPFGPFELAKQFGSEQIAKRLEELAKQFGKKIFEPARTLKEGKLEELLKPKEDAGEKKEEFKTIKIERLEGGVTKLVLNRPDRLNTISPELMDELDKAITMLWNDKDTRVIVITGAGDRAFSAGADLTTLITHPFDFLEHNRRGERVFTRLREIPKPVIAAINGYALGGGLEIAMNCDIRLAKKSAVIGLPEVGLGLLPGWSGTQRMVKLVGISRAMQLALTGERITAEEAEKWGLINKVFDDDRFEEEVMRYARNIAERCAPISMALIKRLINKGGEVPMDIGLEWECTAAGLLFSTEDLREGISAFLRKEKPQFKGR
ncbi:3-hydroxyacyl-CoA dehydrogenase/enoyl-CoA hydratase family protein [Archaeoglobus neptunius]|uniref:3-hydroxyacyl-CoA dehydrogenase/enoyl-CoA hydratase family protein n=1 Tax=Archaeoglobus neptunius TaxID=2798580 RepID=UPI0019272F78|nr:3-hydroxyacyl-CoA dehydrogenase/enoyl-CoA hydratase family protein [Archaeoglobus neptunius]